MKTLTMTLMAAAIAVFPLVSMADHHIDTQKDRVEQQADMRKDTAKSDYKTAKMKCRNLSGKQEDTCLEKARAEYTSAKANAKADEKSGKARLEAQEESSEAEYEAAKERCNEFKGDAEDRCKADAKLKFYQ